MRPSRLLARLTIATVAAAFAAGTIAAAAPTTPAPATTRAPTTWYLSLGDSLALGVGPDGHGHDVPSVNGYADDLMLMLRAKNPGLRLEKLGCSGETTGSMVKGGVCRYPHGASQLTTALAFLHQHQNQVRLVTLDIGANDVLRCVRGASLDRACYARGMAQIKSDLPVILSRLRAAAPGTAVQFAGMDLYDPLLGAWYQGRAGQAAAEQSLPAVEALNALLSQDFRRAGFAVAPVAADFYTSDAKVSKTQNCGTVPMNVGAICHLTWAASPKPFGPDVHPNAVGYYAIATAFRSRLKAPLH